jgi:hypothetical protein
MLAIKAIQALIFTAILHSPTKPTFDHPPSDLYDWPEGVAITALAHMACTEAGENWSEVRAVLSVAVNRSRNWKKPIYDVITQRNQFVLTGCSNPKNRWRQVKDKHYDLAELAYSGKLARPKWMGPRVMWFATEKALKKTRTRKGKTYTLYDRWKGRGWVPVKKTRAGHIYWKDK